MEAKTERVLYPCESYGVKIMCRAMERCVESVFSFLAIHLILHVGWQPWRECLCLGRGIRSDCVYISFSLLDGSVFKAMSQVQDTFISRSASESYLLCGSIVGRPTLSTFLTFKESRYWFPSALSQNSRDVQRIALWNKKYIFKMSVGMLR